MKCFSEFSMQKLKSGRERERERVWEREREKMESTFSCNNSENTEINGINWY